jgi:hypothetical protein
VSPYSLGPVVIDLIGIPVAVPHRPAADWINAVSETTGPTAVLVQLAREGTREAVLNALAEGEMTQEELSAASYDLIKQSVPGFDWWETYRLLILSSDYNALGRCVLAGMDAWKLSVREWVSALYVLLTKDASETDKGKFDWALSEVPEGITPDDDWGDMSFDQMVANARNVPGMS